MNISASFVSDLRRTFCRRFQFDMQVKVNPRGNASFLLIIVFFKVRSPLETLPLLFFENLLCRCRTFILYFLHNPAHRALRGFLKTAESLYFSRYMTFIVHNVLSCWHSHAQSMLTHCTIYHLEGTLSKSVWSPGPGARTKTIRGQISYSVYARSSLIDLRTACETCGNILQRVYYVWSVLWCEDSCGSGFGGPESL